MIETQVNLKKPLKLMHIDKIIPRSNFFKLCVFVSHRLGSSGLRKTLLSFRSLAVLIVFLQIRKIKGIMKIHKDKLCFGSNNTTAARFVSCHSVQNYLLLGSILFLFALFKLSSTLFCLFLECSSFFSMGLSVLNESYWENCIGYRKT